MAEKVLIVKYGEIAMRGNNKYIFINRLISAIRKNLDPYGNYYVVRDPGRLIVENRDGELDYDFTIPKLETIFGLHSICPGVRLEDNSFDTICKEALAHMQEFYGDKEMTFKVNTRRANKSYPMHSMEMSMEVGAYLLDHMPNMRVDVKHPDVTLNIEIRNSTYLHSKTIRTYGGLPYGSNGKAVSLLSGGIDSPVASWMIAKRGIALEMVHFFSYPYTSEEAKQKVLTLAKLLTPWCGRLTVHVVPFTAIQEELRRKCPEELFTVLMRRFMMRIAEAVAQRCGAGAIVTGECLGQVASQTMEAMRATTAVTTLPILRPVVGMDKEEIVRIARKINTFETSILPYEDCCTVFTPRHPRLRPVLGELEAAEAALDVEGLVKAAVDGIERVQV